MESEQPMQIGVQALEEHFYIRFPPDLADSIREDLRAVRRPTDILSFSFVNDRKAELVLSEGERLTGFLVDLPGCTETSKSLDAGAAGGTMSGQYCKVADASQMLVVLPSNDEKAINEMGERLGKCEWQWEDGLTMPMSRARERRFSPETAGLRRRAVELDEVEARVKELVEADAKALDCRFQYTIGGRVIRRSDEPIRSAIEQPDHESVTDDLEADILAELEAEEAEADIVGMQEEVEEGHEEEAEEDPRRRELEQKRAQLARVTNPAIRAFLEETIKQLESEL